MRYILMGFTIFLACCNDTNSRNQNTAEAAKISVASTLTCYGMFTGKDTIMMRLDIHEDVVTGDLVYNFFEKDDNRGTLKGNVKGDTIFATYHFTSEGIASQREVAFIKKGNAYVEGYGALTESDGKVVFKDRHALNFNNNTILAQTDCME